MQLSPNRVNKDFDYGTRDVFFMFPAPVSIPDSPAAPTVGSLLDMVTGSYGSIIGSPVTSLSITDQAEHLHLLLEPLIPLPAVALADDAPERGPAPEVVPPPAAFSREWPFDVSTETAATGDHPLILMGLNGCPYRLTTYRDSDLICVDISFSVQIHHSRFLECAGAPESALS